MIRSRFTDPAFSSFWPNFFFDPEKAFRLMRTADTSHKVFPSVNITEDNDNYFVRAELPGMVSEDLEIEFSGKKLIISGERKIASEGTNVKYHRREREAGKFSRAIMLPMEADGDKAAASMKNGILTIKLPKREEVKPRKIAISAQN
ncbi:heat shock protein Hsp20 [Denitrovibrio acetiphilus DSM 12809]|jgi:HSP20 family protein|uniref:Heat shock protein Hsp20 n=1 Tax=Denitrovibrio acetiphilus (strain DSM 12809 / NBRC 114555 / N2460) TaxID=522772 RepID=D4H8B6_DENA2|nr:Hsp20/alpha crystallin family protein [Denitrovibrio acetiphilus]ADD68265.1 heat shock protein Hsp20 [Denitrovibrio acetiphilus DSM 12809]